VMVDMSIINAVNTVGVDSQSRKADAATDLLKRVGALLDGEFKLYSGKTSNYYFDSKELTLDPEGANFVAEQLVAKLNEIGIEHIGGTAYSAIPIVAHICSHSYKHGTRPISAFYVRKESKGHGLDKLLEGKLPKIGDRVAVVDDVVTSGASLLETIDKVEAAGYEVTDAIALADRGEGGRELIEARGYRLWSLFTFTRRADGPVQVSFNGR